MHNRRSVSHESQQAMSFFWKALKPVVHNQYQAAEKMHLK